MNAPTQHIQTSASVHIPVMLDEVLTTLQPKDGGIYVDGTFGAGGYTRAILEAADCTVYAIDRDPEAIIRAEKMMEEFKGRFYPLHGCFGDVKNLLAEKDISKIDGFVLDVGVSSAQIDTAERGFSFQKNGPLDMRMGKEGQTAADIVNNFPEEDLANIIFDYGDERASRRIAKKIVDIRAERPIQTTAELASLIHTVLPKHPKLKTDTATKTFQALRIYVNDELGELERALKASPKILKPDGRLVVVSFHSLEDGCVKKFFKEQSGKTSNPSRHLPAAPDKEPPLFKLEKNGALKASKEEITTNPRARSARLRYAVRTEAAGETAVSDA